MGQGGQRVLRALTVVLSIGIVVLVVLIGMTFLKGLDKTPHTEAQRAVVEAEDAVKADPNDATSRVKLAAAYLANGAVGAAREQAQTAVRLAPTDPSPHYILGLIEQKAGKHAEAIKELTKAAATKGQIAGFYQDAYAALAVAYRSDGQAPKAFDAMQKALDQGPENAQLYYQRGQWYEADEKWADAWYDYYLALSYAPDLPELQQAAQRVESAHASDVQQARKRFGVESTPTAAPTAHK